MVFWSNDLQMTSLAYGLLLGVVGALLSCLGIWIGASIISTSRTARLLLGGGGQDARARVLNKDVVQVGSTDVYPQSRRCSRTYYLVSYVFDAVRADGMTCRVEVRERKVPSFVWHALAIGGTANLRYMQVEPRVCRLTAAAEHEKRGPISMRARASLAILLFAGGAAAMCLSVIDHHIAGAIAWAVLVGLFTLLSAVSSVVTSLTCCFAAPAKTWSPLFVHPGYVFFSELGRDVQPHDEPTSLVPDNVYMCVGTVDASKASRKKGMNKTFTQQYESEQRKDGVV